MLRTNEINPNTSFKEYLLSTTALNEPRVATGVEAIAHMITRLILMEPGTNPLHPTMGVGLASRFRYTTQAEAENKLKRTIESQIREFLPEYQLVNVGIVYNADKTIDFQIQVDDMMFTYDSSEMIPITISDIINNK